MAVMASLNLPIFLQHEKPQSYQIQTEMTTYLCCSIFFFGLLVARFLEGVFNRIDVDKTGQLTLDQLVEALRVDFLGTVAMLGLLGSQTKKSEDVVTVVEQKS